MLKSILIWIPINLHRMAASYHRVQPPATHSVIVRPQNFNGLTNSHKMVNNVISISGYSNLLLQLPNSGITNVRAVHICGRSLKTNQYAHFDVNRVVRTQSNCMQNRMSDINCQLIGWRPRHHRPPPPKRWQRRPIAPIATSK